MTWKVEISAKAEKKFLKLSEKTRQRILSSLTEMSGLNNPSEHRDVRPLLGELKGFHRLRVGAYRVVFSVLYGKKVIAIVNIAPRSDVY